MITTTAVTVTDDAHARLAVREVTAPALQPAQPDFRPGWDLTGTVIYAAAGSGAAAGTCVVAVPVACFAELPTAASMTAARVFSRTCYDS
jgi:hypothetical protein